jgi:DNA-binding phage protein
LCIPFSECGVEVRQLRLIVDKILGGVLGLAQQAGLNATTLYRTLSGNGNPELRTLRALLDAMGLRLSIAPAS